MKILTATLFAVTVAFGTVSGTTVFGPPPANAASAQEIEDDTNTTLRSFVDQISGAQASSPIRPWAFWYSRRSSKPGLASAANMAKAC